MLKRIVLYPLLVLAILLAAFLSVGQSYFAAYLEQVLIGKAKESSIALSIDNSSLAIPSYTLHGLEASQLSPTYFLQLRLEDLTIQPELLPLLGGKLVVHAFGHAYQGSFRTQISGALGGSQASGELLLEHMLMGAHPQIAGLGFSDGDLTLKCSEVEFENQQLASAMFQANIVNLNKPEKTVISKGLPLPLTIPPLTHFQLNLQGQFSTKRLEIKNFESSSNLGKLSGSVNFTPGRGGKLSNISLETSATLSSAGLELLGPFLPLISQGKLKSDQGKFSLSISGDLATQNLKVTAS